MLVCMRNTLEITAKLAFYDKLIIGIGIIINIGLASFFN
jgi:hypothetical protein